MKKIIATTVAAAVLISGSAFAAGAQSGMVIGANLGLATPTGHMKEDDLVHAMTAAGASTSQDKGNVAGGLFIGYDYALNPMLAVGLELGAQYAYEITKVSGSLGGFTDGNKISVITVPMFLTGKFYIPHTGGLNLFAKMGYAYNRIDTKAEGNAGVLANKDTTLWRPVVAGGIGYQLQQFNIFAQYQYNWLPYQGENSGLGTISAGVSYTIPM